MAVGNTSLMLLSINYDNKYVYRDDIDGNTVVQL